ncbi:MAG TPA: VOC family protein [Thermoplasmata archaeon]|nr:VOC family protein [Thermoplasmata archaeon]
MPPGSRAKKRVIGIGGIFLRSKEPKRLARWYREHLGMEIDNQFLKYEWLSPKDDHHRGTTVWAALASNERDWGRNHPSAMVNYRVEDLAGLLAQLKEEGVEVDGQTEETEHGRFGWVLDPDGNRIELWEPPRREHRPDGPRVEME